MNLSLYEQTVTDYFTLEFDIPTSQFMLTEHQASPHWCGNGGEFASDKILIYYFSSFDSLLNPANDQPPYGFSFSNR